MSTSEAGDSQQPSKRHDRFKKKLLSDAVLRLTSSHFDKYCSLMKSTQLDPTGPDQVRKTTCSEAAESVNLTLNMHTLIHTHTYSLDEITFWTSRRCRSVYTHTHKKKNTRTTSVRLYV